MEPSPDMHDDQQDPDLVVTPMTREMLIEQLNAGMDDILHGRIYTTEEVVASLDDDDEFSSAVKPLSKEQLAAKIQEGLESLERGEVYSTEEVVAFLNLHGRKV
jgi:predicted transcriptional regulator